MKKRKKRFNGIAVVFFVVFFLLMSRYIYYHSYRGRSIQVMQPFLFEALIPSNGLVMKNEFVYGTGEFTSSVDNERISVGTKVGSFVSPSSGEVAGQEITALDEQIARTKDEIEHFNQYISQLKAKDSSYLDNLRFHIQQGELSLNIPVMDQYMDEVFLGFEELFYQLNQLTIQKNIASLNRGDVAAMNAGYLLYKLDGYENSLDITSINYMEVNDFVQGSDRKSAQPVQQDGMKIVDNNCWYLIIQIKNTDMKKQYQEGDKILILVDGKDLKGTIKRIDFNRQDSLFVIEFMDGFELIRDRRFINLDVVNLQTQAFQIPQKALIKKNGQDGVYIVNETGVIVFVPVMVIKEDTKKDLAIISLGINGKITINQQEVDTVKEYQTILINPKALKEGDLLN